MTSLRALAHRHVNMQSLHSRVTRDVVVALAWASATAGLRLWAAGRRLVPALRSAGVAGATAASGPIARVRRLERVAELGVWRCEAVALLQLGAATALANAQDEYEQACAQLAAVMTLPQPAEPGCWRAADAAAAPFAA